MVILMLFTKSLPCTNDISMITLTVVSQVNKLEYQLYFYFFIKLSFQI